MTANLRDGSAPFNLPTPADTLRPPRLGTADAVKYLYEKHGIVVAPSTLKQWAWRGGGPEFQKAGQHRLYPVERLDAWARQRLSPIVTSTSQLTTLIGCDPAQELVQEHAQEPAPAPVPELMQKATQAAAKDGAAMQHNYQSRVRPPPSNPEQEAVHVAAGVKERQHGRGPTQHERNHVPPRRAKSSTLTDAIGATAK